MSCRLKMFGRVFIFGIVAAADVSAGETHPQVDPCIAHLETFLTAVAARFHIAYLVKVCAFVHLYSPCGMHAMV